MVIGRRSPHVKRSQATTSAVRFFRPHQGCPREIPFTFPAVSDNGRMALPKLHISTIVFLVLVAAGILLANIPGQVV